MDLLIMQLEEALRRLKATQAGSMPAVRIEAAQESMRRVLRCLPPEVEHRDVETLTGAHADSAELRGFGTKDPDEG